MPNSGWLVFRRGLFVALALCSTAWLTGCPGRRAAPTRAAVERDKDDELNAVRDTLRRNVAMEVARTATAQLNVYLSREPETRPAALTPAERQLLQQVLKLTPEELTEVERGEFGLLDAHHLGSCFLFHDGLRGFKSSETGEAALLARVERAFAWSMRQVYLLEQPGPAVPPAEALRLGRFNADGRAGVAMEAIRQMGVEPALIGPGGDRPPLRSWAIAVPLAAEVYLFDYRSGQPIAGPGGKGVATLKQVRAEPNLAKSALSASGETGNPKTALDASRLWLCPPLSALSPRMRWLQTILNISPPIVLGVDPLAAAKAFQSAGEPASWWNPPSDRTGLVRRLAWFLPPEEGGLDKTTAPGTRLYDLYREAVVPVTEFPPALRRELGLSDVANRLVSQFRNRFVELNMSIGGPRDLMLRGQFDEASRSLVDALTNTSNVQQRIGNETNLEAGALEWVREIKRAQVEVLEIRSGRRSGNLGEAQARVEALFKSAEKAVLLIEQSVSEPYAAALTYELALCKHEQAARRALDRSAAKIKQEAWKNAANWWNSYLTRFGTSPWSRPEQLAHARMLNAQAQAAAAGSP